MRYEFIYKKYEFKKNSIFQSAIVVNMEAQVQALALSISIIIHLFTASILFSDLL